MHIVGFKLIRINAEDIQNGNFVCPLGITKVGDFACHRNDSLVKVVLKKGVKIIGYSAFSECINLTTIVLPQDISIIRPASFYNCPNLKEIIVDTDDEQEINRVRALIPAHHQHKVTKISIYNTEVSTTTNLFFFSDPKKKEYDSTKIELILENIKGYGKGL